MSQIGANELVESLVAAGVKHLFTLSGNHILSIYNAAIGQDIQLIHTRHEAAAVHMADAWGRLTDRPGVCLLTAGPGHCNALSALYVAFMAESPLVALSGHVPLQQMGKGSFQEIDQVAMAKPVTKAAWLVEEVDRLGHEMDRAFALANEGRPGPVHLSLPTDVLEATLSTAESTPVSDDLNIENSSILNDKTLDEILSHLSKAKRPLILTGPAMGRSRRWVDVSQLSTVMGIPALPMESPRGVNDPWLHRAANYLPQADAVLLLGKKIDFSLGFGRPPFFAPSCHFIQIDADRTQLRETEGVILALCANPSIAVRQLGLRARTRQFPTNTWSEEIGAARDTLPAEWEHLRQSSDRPIHPLRVCEALQPFLEDEGILVSDGGEFGQWAQAGLVAQTRLINGLSGSIGSSLPMALGAKLVHPNRQVFVTMGDGTFGYHALEIDTALRYNLPVIVIIGNDARWNAEYQLQLRHYGPDRTVGCELMPSRYDKLAAALGGHGEFVQHPDELAPALQRAAASGVPACVNVRIKSVSAPTF